MQYVTPCYINSPVTGNPSKPRIMTFERGGKIYEEAHWFCPDSGMFIRKGIISVKDKEVKKEKLLTESSTDPYGPSGTDTARAQAKKWSQKGRDIYKDAEKPIGEDSDDRDLRDIWKETEVIEKVKEIHDWDIEKQGDKWWRFDAPGGPREITGDEHWDIMRIEDPEKYEQYHSRLDRSSQDSGDRPDVGVMGEGNKPGFMGSWGKKLDLTDPWSRVPTPINPDRAL